jgi:hypothetical protein
MAKRGSRRAVLVLFCRAIAKVACLLGLSFLVGSGTEAAIQGNVITNAVGVWYRWPIAEGGNDHWYGFVSITVPQNKTSGIASQWGGTLACLTEPGELEFVAQCGRNHPETAYVTGLAAEPGQVFRWPDGTAATVEFLQAHFVGEWTTATNNFGYWRALGVGFGGGIFPHSIGTLDIPVLFVVEVSMNPNSLPPAAYVLVTNPNSPPPAMFYYVSLEEQFSTEPLTFQAHALTPTPAVFEWYMGDVLQSEAKGSRFWIEMAEQHRQAGVSVVCRSTNGQTRVPVTDVRIIPSQHTGRVRWAQWSTEEGGNGNWYGYWPYFDFVTNAMTWEGARNLAEELGAELVTLQSESEWHRWISFPGNPQNASPVPLGLSDSLSEGTFVWLDGSIAQIQHWGAGEPASDDPEKDYAYVTMGNSKREWRTTKGLEEMFGTVWMEKTNAPPTEIAPKIFGMTSSFTMMVGETRRIKLEVLAGAGSIYEWLRNGELIKTSTVPFLDLVARSTNQSGDYQIVVRNGMGAATSRPVMVSIVPQVPVELTVEFDRHVDAYTIRFDYAFEPDVLETSDDLMNWVSRDQLDSYQPGLFPHWATGFNRNETKRFFRVRRLVN